MTRMLHDHGPLTFSISEPLPVQAQKRPKRKRPAQLDEEDKLFEAVTRPQIQTVPQKYLKPDAFVVSVLKPNRK